MIVNCLYSLLFLLLAAVLIVSTRSGVIPSRSASQAALVCNDCTYSIQGKLIEVGLNGGDADLAASFPSVRTRRILFTLRFDEAAEAYRPEAASGLRILRGGLEIPIKDALLEDGDLLTVLFAGEEVRITFRNGG